MAGRALLETSLWVQKSDSVLHISDHRRATCVCDTMTMEGCDAREENRGSLPHSYAKRARREVRRGLRWHAYGNRGRADHPYGGGQRPVASIRHTRSH